METLIGLTLSMVVTAGMVILMGNSMGTATRIIEMSQLSDELRNAMSMMSRDVRRANYSANAIYCYANSHCGDIGGSAEQGGDIFISDDNTCFTFGLDRNSDGNAANDPAGGFRLAPGGTFMEMWVGDNSPECDAVDNDWIELTDPDAFTITTFLIADGGSFARDIEGEGEIVRVRQREIQIILEGEVNVDPRITRRVEDTIRVRNDYFAPSI